MLVPAGVRTKNTYRQLRQPPFNPPGSLFAPVWTVSYGMMGYAAHHATMTASRSFSLAVRYANDSAQTLYTAQLVLNNLWNVTGCQIKCDQPSVPEATNCDRCLRNPSCRHLRCRPP
jgi:tryptophan-rich sensory protein